MGYRARSLRFKLALWFVAVFTLIQVTLVGGVVLFRRETIRRSLEDSLTTSAGAMVDNILAAEADWNSDQLSALVPAGAEFELYAVRDHVGRALVSWRVADVDRLPFSTREAIPAGPVGGVHTTIGVDRAQELTGERIRLHLITLPFRSAGQLFFFQAAVRDEALQRLLGPFRDLVAIGVPIGILAALIAAWVLGGRVVAPLERIAKAARRVSPARLNERFEIPTTDEEVARMEVELNSALERLEAGYRAQDQFISNVSHELRTPIAVLLAQAQVAKMGERNPHKAYAFVEATESLMKRFGALLESFLLLARADLTRDRPPDPVSVFDVVLGCVHSCKQAAEQRSVRLVPTLADRDGQQESLAIEGDAELLQAMVENLVHNAIRHSPPGEQVAIDVDFMADSVRIVVRDHGPGIPEEILERVFERFVKGAEPGAAGNGAGLGLAIAKGIVQLHRGTIEACNLPGGGCSFTVVLPGGGSGH